MNEYAIACCLLREAAGKKEAFGTSWSLSIVSFLTPFWMNDHSPVLLLFFPSATLLTTLFALHFALYSNQSIIIFSSINFMFAVCCCSLSASIFLVQSIDDPLIPRRFFFFFFDHIHHILFSLIYDRKNKREISLFSLTHLFYSPLISPCYPCNRYGIGTIMGSNECCHSFIMRIAMISFLPCFHPIPFMAWYTTEWISVVDYSIR